MERREIPPNVFGMHDPGDWRILFEEAGKTGWVMFSQILTDDVASVGNREFAEWAQEGFGVLARLIHAPFDVRGTGRGSIPPPEEYAGFARRCAQFVENSPGCQIWFIGNEMNIEWHWPAQGQPRRSEAITPRQYADCFSRVYEAIKEVQRQAWVIPSGLNPLKRPNARHEDALDWFRDMLQQIQALDGLDIHAYFPLADGRDVDRAYTFDEFLELVPRDRRDLPVFLSETTPPEPWPPESDGWMQRTYAEINRWNHNPGHQAIYALLPYRWGAGDQTDRWDLAHKPSYRDDLGHVLQHEYLWQVETGQRFGPPLEAAQALERMRVVESSLADLSFDALVSPTDTELDSDLWSGGRLRAAEAVASVREKGFWGTLRSTGREMREQAEVWRKERALTPAAIGQAVAVSAGRMPARHIIHVPVREKGQEVGTESEEDLMRGIRAALALADRLGDVRHLVVPSVTTAWLGRSADGSSVARILLSGTRDYLQGGSRLEQVTFALPDQRGHDVYAAELDALRSAAAPGPRELSETDEDALAEGEYEDPLRLLEMGQGALADGEYEGALSLLDRAIELLPEGPERAAAYSARGNAYYQVGDYEQAVTDFDRASELNPKNAAIFYHRAMAYAALQKPRQAIAGFQRAPEPDPEDTAARDLRRRGVEALVGGLRARVEAEGEMPESLRAQIDDRLAAAERWASSEEWEAALGELEGAETLWERWADERQKAEPRFWLVTADPNRYPWERAMTEEGEGWTGVRGAQAQGFLEQSRAGDTILAYASDPRKEIVGVGRIVEGPSPVEVGEGERPRQKVQIRIDRLFGRGVKLEELGEATPDLDHVVRWKASQRPLSFSPVTPQQWATIRGLLLQRNSDLDPDEMASASVPPGLPVETEPSDVLHQAFEEGPAEDEVEEVPAARLEVRAESPDGLALRQAPSADAQQVAVVEDGAILVALGDPTEATAMIGAEGKWLHVQAPDGIEGYAAAWYLSLPTEREMPTEAPEPTFDDVIESARAQIRAPRSRERIEALNSIADHVRDGRWDDEQRVRLIQVMWQAFDTGIEPYRRARRSGLGEIRSLSEDGYRELVEQALAAREDLQQEIGLALSDEYIAPGDREWLASLLQDAEVFVTQVLDQPLDESGAPKELTTVFQQFAWQQVVREVERPDKRLTTRILDIHVHPRYQDRAKELEGVMPGGRVPQYQVVLQLLEQMGGRVRRRPVEGPFKLDLGAAGMGEPYGAALHRALFHDDEPRNEERVTKGDPGLETLKDAYLLALGLGMKGDDILRLQLRLNTQTPRLHGYRWEYLWDPHGKGGGPLACWDRTPFARVLHVSSDTDVKLPRISGEHPLRILAAMASPRELRDDYGEAKQEQVKALHWFDQALVRTLPENLVRLGNRVEPVEGDNLLMHASLEGLKQRLQEAADEGRPFHVLHLVCHGLEEGGRGFLVLEKGHSALAHLVPEEDFAGIIRSFLHGPEGEPGLRLVVFASCWTARPTDEQPLQGVGRRMVADGQVPAVVAMQHRLGFEAAQHFAQRMYAHLVHHGEIDRAVNAGRRELRMQGRLPGSKVDRLQWGVPVLFMRQPDGRLFEIEKGEGIASFNPDLETEAVPYEDAPGADPQRVARGMLQTVAAQLGTSLNPNVLARQLTRAFEEARKPREPEPAVELHRVLGREDERERRSALVQAVARHRGAPARRTVLFLRGVAREKIGQMVKEDRLKELEPQAFVDCVCLGGNAELGKARIGHLLEVGKHEVLTEEHALRKHSAADFREHHRGFEAQSGDALAEKLTIEGNLIWPAEQPELPEGWLNDSLAGFREELRRLLRGEGDPFDRFTKVTGHKDDAMRAFLERSASYLLHVVHPDRYAPYEEALAGHVLRALGQEEADRYRHGFEGYCTLAADLLADEDLGFQDLADVAYFFQRLGHDRKLPEDAPQVDAAERIKLVEVDLKEREVDTGLILRRGTVGQAVAALNAKQHVILIGPPGTGKTTLAEDLCRHAHDQNCSRGHVLVTATADWTTFDTIGGYMPESGDRLVFRPGLFLEAIAAQKWLVIDEINRADIDKAFGELFTVLSGQAVTLPYKVGGRPVRILPPGHPTSEHTCDYVIHPNWRIIGTMNVYDKASLFAMSYAFMRRFAFVDVALPAAVPYQKLVQHFLWSAGLLDEEERAAEELPSGVIKDLCDLFKRDDPADDDELTEGAKKLNHLMRWRALGPAIAQDVVRYLHHRTDGNKEDLTHGYLAEALALYAAPQFDGLERHQILHIHGQLKAQFDWKNRNRQYKELQSKREEGRLTGVELAKFEQAEIDLGCVRTLLERIEELFPYISRDEWKGSKS